MRPLRYCPGSQKMSTRVLAPLRNYPLTRPGSFAGKLPLDAMYEMGVMLSTTRYALKGDFMAISTRSHTCPVCGNPVHFDPKRRAIYCSEKCRVKAWRMKHKKQPKPKPVKHCTNCGAPYEVHSPVDKFCCHSCQSSFWQQQKRIAQKEMKRVA